ncbi:MAG: nadD [Candidatus Saccharibacteria bacterium]|nr:nadD [Candidatus Saccharibacteria bacterium]
MEIAIFGGSFNPPTRAHEAGVQACLDRQDIDEVWLMPSGYRADKPGLVDDQARLEMLQIVKRQEFYDNPRVVISDFELSLPRPTQTYKTMGALARAYPEHRFWFVSGADTYATMQNWEGGHQLKASLPMLLIPRIGYELPEPTQQLRQLEVLEDMVDGISSSQVRERLALGGPIEFLVCDAIARYIAEKGLYLAKGSKYVSI